VTQLAFLLSGKKHQKGSAVPSKHRLRRENRVEVPLSDLISHSCTCIFEFFLEENSPIVQNLTEVDKMSLELWGKIGGDGQGEYSQYSWKNNANASRTSV
jgi:hypothetical protein